MTLGEKLRETLDDNVVIYGFFFFMYGVVAPIVGIPMWVTLIAFALFTVYLILGWILHLQMQKQLERHNRLKAELYRLTATECRRT